MPTPLPILPSLTLPPSPSPTPAPTATPEPTVTPTLTITPMEVRDETVILMQSAGYERVLLPAPGEGVDAPFGILPQLTRGPFGFQILQHYQTGNCQLVFTIEIQGHAQALEIIDASRINARLLRAVYPQDGGRSSIRCIPFGWDDANRNGKLDMTVAFIWAEGLAGSEVHIFEIDGRKVTNLTAHLDGKISPWDFHPRDDGSLLTFDPAWLAHDCLNPPLNIPLRYDWVGDFYTDRTREEDFSERIQELRAQVEAGFGGPFAASEMIPRMTELLLLYDTRGKRMDGWKEYMRLADTANWPDTPELDAEWLESDRAHFSLQVTRGEDFSPNDFCR